MRLILVVMVLFSMPSLAVDVSETEYQWTVADYAKAHGVTEKDWRKYQSIMRGPRGRWTPEIDPILALGIHAQSETERRRFAKLYLDQETKRADDELAFVRVYSEIYDAEFANHPLMLVDDNQDWQLLDRVMLVVDRNCCDNAVRQVLNANRAVDLYVYDSTDEELREWLASFAVDQSKTQSRMVTLNHAEPWEDKLGRDLPSIFRSRNGTLTQMVSLP